MIFQKAKDMDTAFRQLRLFSLSFLVLCFGLCLLVTLSAHRQMKEAQARIYILAGGKALEAFSADRKDNIPVEARDHVSMFHHYFFTLDPDDKVIQSHISSALYLADASAKQQYDNLKENGFYSNLIAGNISQEINADSILIRTDSYPYRFIYKGEQRIIRPSSVVTRILRTEGYLRNVARSDNNPHGFLIEGWKILENYDLSTEQRATGR